MLDNEEVPDETNLETEELSHKVKDKTMRKVSANAKSLFFILVPPKDYFLSLDAPINVRTMLGINPKSYVIARSDTQ